MKLPEGWKDDTESCTDLILKHPEGGWVTFSWTLRSYTFGICQVRKDNCRVPIGSFTGRKWKERLIAKGIEDLTNIEKENQERGRKL